MHANDVGSNQVLRHGHDGRTPSCPPDLNWHRRGLEIDGAD